MNSEWVKTEIRKAHHAELRLPKSSETSEVFSRQKLFPIRLVSIDRIRDWSCFDADTGKDLAVELREYHIPDFSNWKNHDAIESALRLELAALGRPVVVEQTRIVPPGTQADPPRELSTESGANCVWLKTLNDSARNWT